MAFPTKSRAKPEPARRLIIHRLTLYYVLRIQLAWHICLVTIASRPFCILATIRAKKKSKNKSSQLFLVQQCESSRALGIATCARGQQQKKVNKKISYWTLPIFMQALKSRLPGNESKVVIGMGFRT